MRLDPGDSRVTAEASGDKETLTAAEIRGQRGEGLVASRFMKARKTVY